MGDINSVIRDVRSDFGNYLAGQGKKAAEDKGLGSGQQKTIGEGLKLISQALEDGQIDMKEFKTLEANLIKEITKDYVTKPDFQELNFIRKEVETALDQIIGKDFTEKLRSGVNEPVQIKFEKVGFKDGNLEGTLKASFSTHIAGAQVSIGTSTSGSAGKDGASAVDPKANLEVKGNNFAVKVTASDGKITATASFAAGGANVSTSVTAKGANVQAAYGPFVGSADSQGNVQIRAGSQTLQFMAESHMLQKGGNSTVNLKITDAAKTKLLEAGATISETKVDGQVHFNVSFASGEKFRVNADGQVLFGNDKFKTSVGVALNIKLAEGVHIKISVGASVATKPGSQEVETIAGITAGVEFD